MIKKEGMIIMLCSKCGTQNMDGAKFCIKCGNPINEEIVQTSTPVMEQNVPVMSSNQPMSEATPVIKNENIQTENKKISIGEYFSIILAVLLKPFTALQKELPKFSQFKNSAVLSVIVSVLFTCISLLMTMFNAVVVKSGGLFSKSKTKIVFENLKYVEYVKEIGVHLLLFLGIIFAIACVYYIAGLIAKKQSNFSKLLGISAISVVPMLIGSLVVSPILTMFSETLGMLLPIAGGVYTLIIAYEAINNEIVLEKNAKYYFNLICLSILLIAGYYLYMKMYLGDLGDLFDFFG